MKKKTLEEKIRLVGFWTFGFVFWYLVIAFFLKSSYPIYEYSFNREDAYDTIKDALTLAAAFLAPVAAFVLFSDWRAQHKELSNEKNSKLIINAFNLCHSSISYYGESIDFQRQYSNFMNNLFTINTLTNEIYTIDENSLQFIQNAKEASSLFNSALPKWIQLVNIHQQNTSGYNSAQLVSFNELQLQLINDYSGELQKIAKIRNNLVQLKI